jgi:hypothetical protein
MLRQPSACALVKLCRKFIGWNAMSVETLPSGDHLPAKPRIFVHFEHVHAQVRKANAGCDVQRVLPTCRSLIRKPRDQVGTHIRYSGCLQTKDFMDTVAFSVTAANGCAFAIDKRLHAKTDTVDTQALGLGEHRVGDLPRCGFECDLRARFDLERLVQGGEDAAKLPWLEQTGSSTAQVDSVDRPRQICM